ncbi:dephospho-CoA kinase [Aromatoleum sp.]|uniref:dephospho-CoA kinase n=1 Tax=Aromatoleum sp. TaxID=2307007 RepID=UPI002FCB4D5C
MTLRPYIIGLTGGIGSGKSAAADRFAALGATVIDTDAVAHRLTAPGGLAIGPIRAAFGEAVITPEGALDRVVMRELAFSDPDARRRLEAILHPAIRDECERLIGAADSPYVVLGVPLLIESKSYRERCDRICVVDCPVEMQVSRVMLRNGLEEARVRTIIAAQVSRDERLAAADDVIDNSTSLATLHAQVNRLHEKYLEAASKRA